MKPCVAALALLCAACTQPDLQIYTVAKEAGPAAPAPASAAAAEAGGPGVRWSVPSGWASQPGGGMRLASFLVPTAGGGKAEVSVVALPGDAGGDLANVNRWRGQIGLGALGAGELARQSRKLFPPAGELLLVDFTGAPGKGRMMGARLLAGGRTWFFKMTGEEASVAKAKPAFERFLGSLRRGQ